MASALTILRAPTWRTSTSAGCHATYADETYVNSLGVVAEPIAKVDTLDVHLGELLAVAGAAHQKGEQGVLDIAMTPVLALDLSGRGDVASAEGMAGARQEDEQHQA